MFTTGNVQWRLSCGYSHPQSPWICPQSRVFPSQFVQHVVASMPWITTQSNKPKAIGELSSYVVATCLYVASLNLGMLGTPAVQYAMYPKVTEACIAPVCGSMDIESVHRLIPHFSTRQSSNRAHYWTVCCPTLKRSIHHIVQCGAA